MAGTIVAGGTSICKTLHKCRLCGKEFYPRRSDRTKFCGRECGLAFSGAQIAGRNGCRVSVSVHRCKCVVCGKRFTGRTLKAKFCSSGCAAADARQKERASSVASYVARQYECAECGVWFSTIYGNKHRKYCSPACLRRAGRRAARQARRAERRGVAGQKLSAVSVFERDGWRCQICGKKTARGKRGTSNPMAPELDHIIPLARGGDHSYANTQCACRACNGAKGATTYGQLNLFP